LRGVARLRGTMASFTRNQSKLLLAVLILAGALVGCSGGDSAPTSSERTASEASADGASADASASSTSSLADEPVRDAIVYAAVIEQLVEETSPDRGDPPFKILFVLDGAVPHAATPTHREDPRAPFSDEVKHDLRALAALSDYPDIEFVSTRDSAVVGTDSGNRAGQARDGGAVISLGPIKRKGRRVEVPTSLWVNGLWGQWQTYVLVENDGVWKVTGTTGPLAIS
jgi:hypothetical protein